MGDEKTFELLPAQHSCSYKMRLEDVGRCLKCECIVTDVFGRSTEPVYAETGPILPGISFPNSRTTLLVLNIVMFLPSVSLVLQFDDFPGFLKHINWRLIRKAFKPIYLN